MVATHFRAAVWAVGGGILLASLPMPSWAYGLDGLFGGRPNPDGSVTIDIPVSTSNDTKTDRAESVLDHPRPDYDPTPIRVGSFLVSPVVEGGLAYNSNIYDTPQGTGDTIYILQPSIVAVSDWSRNYLAIAASGDFDYFQNNPSQNLNNAVVQVNGRYDIAAETWLGGRAGYQSQIVPRYTLDNNQGNQPETFNLYSAGATAYRGLGLIHAQLDYDFDRYDFNTFNNQTPDGSLTDSQFNRDENNVGGTLTYAVTDDFQPYVRTQFNARTYDMSDTRSSTGYRADVGAKWDFGGITSLDIYTGWLSQDYSNYGAEPVDAALDFGGRMMWNVTGLTTLILDANRSVQEATIDGYNSYLDSTGTATLTHELRRNILIEGDLAYSTENYRGFSERQDDVESAGAGARWLINRNLFADLDYNLSHRTSDVEGQGYVQHLVVGKIGVRF